jgi:hypothetical protein
MIPTLTPGYRSRARRLPFGSLVLLMGLSASAHAAAAADCDRGCLRELLDRYLGAVFKHQPALAPLAGDHRATENGAVLSNGTGIWTSAKGLGALGRRYFDVSSGQAAYFGLLEEGDAPAIVSLRLRIEKRSISEAEWTVARQSAGGMFSVEGLLATPPPPDTAIPRSERSARGPMIAAANAYFEGLQKHDGSQVPHIAGCERIENGVKVTHRTLEPRAAAPGKAAPAPGAAGAAAATQAEPGLVQETRSGDCASGLENFAQSIADTSHRRFPLVDEEAGVVLGATLFHRPPGVTTKRNLLTEYFYEQQGKISGIYAAMYYLDPGAPDTPGW